jgi:3D (Asp-Asp-Asp) domain-containing protein
MDERQPPISSDSLHTRVVRFATVMLCAALCSAVVGAVGVKPGGSGRTLGSGSAPPEGAPAAPSFEPVEMVAVDGLGQAVAPRGPVTPPSIAATSELLRPVGSQVVSPAVVPKPAPPRLAPIRIMRMEVTAYCHCVRCCGPAAQGVTASGKSVRYNGGLFVAADTNVLPFGTRLVIPGYAGNQPVEVIDRGGAIKGHKLDVYYPSHGVAREWGRRFVDVIVLE